MRSSTLAFRSRWAALALGVGAWLGGSPPLPAAPSLAADSGPPQWTLWTASGRGVSFEAGPAGLEVAELHDAPNAGAAPERLDLQPGDVLERLAGETPTTLDALRQLLDRLPPGEEEELSVRRAGDEGQHLVRWRKPSRERLEALGVFAIPASSPLGGGGQWVAMRSEGDGPMLSICGNEIRADDDGRLKVLFKRRDPDTARADLRPLDEVEAINGTAVGDMEALLRAYAAIPVGGQVQLAIRRHGEALVVTFAKPGA